MANVGIKFEPVFYHKLDGTDIKIIKLDGNTFLWAQFKDVNGGLDIELTKVYNLNDMRSMVSLFSPYGSMGASEIFEKFINT